MRRIAAAELVVGGKTYKQSVAELDDDGQLIRFYPLTEELPHTEWCERLEL